MNTGQALCNIGLGRVGPHQFGTRDRDVSCINRKSFIIRVRIAFQEVLEENVKHLLS